MGFIEGNSKKDPAGIEGGSVLSAFGTGAPECFYWMAYPIARPYEEALKACSKLEGLTGGV
jgi:hypothetical protein